MDLDKVATAEEEKVQLRRRRPKARVRGVSLLIAVISLLTFATVCAFRDLKLRVAAQETQSSASEALLHRAAQGESPLSASKRREALQKKAEEHSSEERTGTDEGPSRQSTRKSIRDVSHWRDAVGVVLIAVFCVVAVAAGTGGGSVYVPVMTLVMGFSPHAATAMSQALMCGGVLAGTLLNLPRRNPETGAPLIDVDLVILLAPAQMAGVSLGQVVNRCLPPWLLVGFLVCVLSVALHQTAKQYRRCRGARATQRNAAKRVPPFERADEASGEETQRRQNSSLSLRNDLSFKDERNEKEESEHLQRADESSDGRLSTAEETLQDAIALKSASASVLVANKNTEVEGLDSPCKEDKEPPRNSKSRLARTKRRLKKADERHGILKWLLLIVIWITDVGVGLLRGGDGSPIRVVQYCGMGYWTLYVTSAMLLITASFVEGMFLIRQQNAEAAGRSASESQEVEERAASSGELIFSLRTVQTLLLQTLLAGFVAGVVGIGSALVMGPLLLLRGVLPVVSSAVNTALVLCSSSSAAAKAMLDTHTPSDYAALLFALCFICALAGKSFVDRLVKKHDADYVLVLLLVLIMTASMISMLASGIIGVLSDASQAFKGPCG